LALVRKALARRNQERNFSHRRAKRGVRSPAGRNARTTDRRLPPHLPENNKQAIRGSGDDSSDSHSKTPCASRVHMNNCIGSGSVVLCIPWKDNSIVRSECEAFGTRGVPSRQRFGTFRSSNVSGRTSVLFAKSPANQLHGTCPQAINHQTSRYPPVTGSIWCKSLGR
jgi:hypothetical protein